MTAEAPSQACSVLTQPTVLIQADTSDLIFGKNLYWPTKLMSSMVRLSDVLRTFATTAVSGRLMQFGPLQPRRAVRTHKIASRNSNESGIRVSSTSDVIRTPKSSCHFGSKQKNTLLRAKCQSGSQTLTPEPRMFNAKITTHFTEYSYNKSHFFNPMAHALPYWWSVTKRSVRP